MSPGETATDLFRAIGLTWLKLDGGRFLLRSRWSDAAAVVEEAEFRALRRCAPFRPLGVHAKEISREGDGSPLEIRERLARFAAEGLLTRLDDLLRAGREAARMAPARVEHVCVVTRDRPESLRSCLESVTRNLREHGREARILVADAGGSSCPPGVGYIGPRQKARFAADLVRAGADAESVAFALEGVAGIEPSPGRNRNALLLETAGSMFVSLDDDVVWDPRLPEGADSGVLACDSGSDPTEFRFFADRAGVLAAARPAPADLLGVHERVLGRSAAVLAASAERLDLDQANDDFLRGMKDVGSRVRVTQTGLYGDCGMGTPAGLLALSGPSRERLAATYPMPRKSREVIRGAARVTLSNGPHLMAYSAGFDHREPLPPFTPVLRNEDGCFGAALRKAFEADRVGHLPWLALHAPPASRAWPENAIRTQAFVTRFSGLLQVCMASARVSSHLDAGGRLGALGAHLEELAAAPLEEFRRAVRSALWDSASRWIQLVEERLREAPADPAGLKEDVREALQDLRSRLLGSDFVVPADLLPGRSPEEALELARSLVSRMGRLYRNWASMLAAARDLRRGGRGLAE